MGLKKANKYSEEIREQVVRECIETSNYSVVSRKYEILVTTICGWIKKEKEKTKQNNQKSKKNYEKELRDLKLENRILKELLKKTHQLWIKD